MMEESSWLLSVLHNPFFFLPHCFYVLVQKYLYEAQFLRNINMVSSILAILNGQREGKKENKMMLAFGLKCKSSKWLIVPTDS